MDTIDWSQAIVIAPDELPTAITTYLSAHLARDLDTAIAHFDSAIAIAKVNADTETMNLASIGKARALMDSNDYAAAAAAVGRASAMRARALSSCAADRNHASNGEGGRYTPPSSMAWKNAA